MARALYTFMFRIKGRNPDRIPMERLGEYIREFAELIGRDNEPVFKGIKTASTGIRARVPTERRPFAHHRFREAIQQPDSRPGRLLAKLESMLGDDKVLSAEILNSDGSKIAVLHGLKHTEDQCVRVVQTGFVDGTVTGLLGSDDTVHLHMRDDEHRDVKLVIRDIAMAKRLLTHFRSELVRVYARGSWLRSENGWTPDSKCLVERFEVLDPTPLSTVLDEVAQIEGNAWTSLDDPMAFWNELRGIH